MPAEWAPHAATWIAWPHNAEDWPGKFQPIPWVYAEIVRHLSQVEDVHILVNDAPPKSAPTASSSAPEPTSPASTSTTGPPTASGSATPAPSSSKNPQGDLAITNWKFNAWAKYDNWHRDNQIPHHVAQLYDIPEFKPEVLPGIDPNGKPHRLVLEGGSIDTNGAGILLTTEECLLSEIQQRNPGLGRIRNPRNTSNKPSTTTSASKKSSGSTAAAPATTPTATSTTSPASSPKTRSSPASSPTPATRTISRSPKTSTASAPSATSHNKPFDIVELPMPAPVVFEGQRLPASYANFYIANGLVLVPTFNDPNDRHALNIIASCFPTAKSSASTPSTSSGASAPSTASPSRNPHERPWPPPPDLDIHQGTGRDAEFQKAAHLDQKRMLTADEYEPRRRSALRRTTIALYQRRSLTVDQPLPIMRAILAQRASPTMTIAACHAIVVRHYEASPSKSPASSAPKPNHKSTNKPRR